MRRWPRRLRRGLIAALAATASGLVALYAYAHLAPLAPLEVAARGPGVVIVDAHGEVIFRDTADGLSIPVPLEAVAPIMVQATVSAEDERFWGHPGVDPVAAARAVLTYRSNPSGASTITQQLARNLYLQGGSLPLPLRKSREALIALQLEARYSKAEILEAYLNTAYYGRQAYGVEAAAQTYFGVSARYLDAAQATFLAGLPQLPAVFGAEPTAAAALERRAYVASRLASRGVLSAGEAELAATAPLAILPAEAQAAAPHFAGFVLEQLAAVRPDLAMRDDLVIETTLDLRLQREAERIVRLRLAEIERNHATNAAAVVVDPTSGAVLAMVGGAEFEAAGGQINMAVSPRQPGSALKPFLYAAAFERGYTAASMLLDVPTSYRVPGGHSYTPHNYDLRYRGPTTVRTALASSLNIPAVRTLADIGVPALLEMSHRVGLDSLGAAEAYGLALTLGAGEVTLLDLTSAYGALANEGRLAEPFVVTRVLDRSGAVLHQREPAAGVEVVSSEHAWLLGDILSDPAARLPGFGGYSILETPFWSAVKTGTSSDFRDNWTIGYTPNRVVGVWVGNNDHSPMVNISGVDGAAPIWRDLIEAAVEDSEARTPVRPSSLALRSVCAPTGLLPGRHCPSTVDEWFVPGTEPSTVESYYGVDPAGALTIAPPVEARAWAAQAGHTLAAGDDAGLVAIVEPPPGTVVYHAAELGAQEVLLRASVPPDARRVVFWIDGELAGEAAALDAWVIAPLVSGSHRIDVHAELADGSVASATSDYEVRER